jgi:hypothetical protein
MFTLSLSPDHYQQLPALGAHPGGRMRKVSCLLCRGHGDHSSSERELIASEKFLLAARRTLHHGHDEGKVRDSAVSPSPRNSASQAALPPDEEFAADEEWPRFNIRSDDSAQPSLREKGHGKRYESRLSGMSGIVQSAKIRGVT